LKKLYVAVALCLGFVLAGGSAYAFSFSYYPEFGTSVFDANNNTSPINYPGVGYLPSPGSYAEGGENFDEEGLFLGYKNGSLYGALTNSFGAGAYSPSWQQTYATGHLFFGLNGAYDQFAINLADGKLYKVNAWENIQNIPGSYYSNATIRNKVGAFRMTSGVYIATLSDFMMTSLKNYEGVAEGPNPLAPSSNRDTYVYEWRIDMSLLSSYMSGPASKAKFHHTLGCGNDLIEREVAIPEPTTLILFGSGLLGFALYRRRR